MSVTLKDLGFEEVDDPVVRKELEEALQAAAVTGGRRRRGGTREEERRAAAQAKAERDEERRRRGEQTMRNLGVPFKEEPSNSKPDDTVRQVSIEAVKNPSALAGKVDSALRAVAPTAAAVGATVVAVNHPNLISNLAEVVAISLANITDIAVTSTWSDWGQAVLGIGRAIGVIGETGALQAFTGPTIPFAIATAIMTWRARKNGKDLFGQIKSDATAASSSAAAAAAAAAASVKKAVRPDPMEALFELADRVRVLKIAGAGAEELRNLVRTELRGIPAAQGTAAGVGQVPAGRGPVPDLRAALGPIARVPFGVDVGATSRTAAEKAAADAEEAEALARLARPPMRSQLGKRGREGEGTTNAAKQRKPDPDSEEGEMGGRRKTKKRKSKRRVTRRRRPVTVVKFAY